MTLVLVHGVPETPQIWGALIERLGRADVVTPQLPGFGCALPVGFEPTMHGYAAWLRDELNAVEGPIDLVGHDWGALLTLRIVADRHPGIRSWVTDGADIGPDFEWHDLAKAWQTPGVGEELMNAMVTATDEERTAINASSGIPESAAETFRDAFDETMAAAILSLYRSAVDVGTEWGDAIDHVAVPTLLVEATEDPFRAEGAVQSAATRLGADVLRLDTGHWWMTERPDAAAAGLTAFWTGVS